MIFFWTFSIILLLESREGSLIKLGRERECGLVGAVGAVGAVEEDAEDGEELVFEGTTCDREPQTFQSL